MKITINFFVALFLSSNNPNYVVVEDIQLDDNYKVESTFSGNTTNENSFHIIIAKNKKTKAYDIIPYLYNKGSIVKLSSIAFDKMPTVLSFHNKEDQLSLITQSKFGKSEFLNVIDINLKSGDYIKSEGLETEDFKALIRKKDRNLILYANEDIIKVVEAKTSKDITRTTATANESATKFLKSLSKSNIDAINTDEFVANGSISTFRAYNEGDEVIITEEDTKTATTNSVQIPLNHENEVTFDMKAFQNGSEDRKIKKSTSYVYKDKLYQLKISKTSASMDIFGINDRSNTNIDLMIINPSNSAKGFTSTQNFVKQASKNVNEPTVTINSTREGKLKLRFDFVNKNVYSYRYDWWWHHQWHMQQQMMLMNQQHMRANIPKFGPSGPEDYFFVANDKNYFEIMLDNSGKVVDGNSSELKYKDLDKESYIKQLDDNKNLKYTSTVFTETKFRYMAYNKKTKSFKILEKYLND